MGNYQSPYILLGFHVYWDPGNPNISDKESYRISDNAKPESLDHRQALIQVSGFRATGQLRVLAHVQLLQVSDDASSATAACRAR